MFIMRLILKKTREKSIGTHQNLSIKLKSAFDSTKELPARRYV